MEKTTKPQGGRHKGERFSVKNAFLAFAVVSFLFAYALTSVVCDSSVVGLGRALGSVGVFGAIEISSRLSLAGTLRVGPKASSRRSTICQGGDLTLKLKRSSRDDFAWLAYEMI
jgi:hypothetical protein